MKMMTRPPGVSFADLADTLPDSLLAPVDRVRSLDGAMLLTKHQQDWLHDGVVYLKSFLPGSLIDEYQRAWLHANDARPDRAYRAGGWPYDTPYLHVPELRRLSLYPPLMVVMKELIGAEMGLHLNLTGWVTTARDFHQDSYLNPEFVGSRYAAVWMALDKIHPDSGPFEFVPGSNRWPVIRQKNLFKYLSPEQQADPTWPAFTQEWVADLCLEEARRREAPVEIFTPERGDVLIWSSGLIHRGSPAKQPGMTRKSLIAHYSALNVRTDMPDRRVDENGQSYFWFNHEAK